MITKSAYQYTIHYKDTKSGNDEEMEVTSFTPLTKSDLIAEVIGDSDNVSFSGFAYTVKGVVLGMEEADFINAATLTNRKPSGLKL